MMAGIKIVEYTNPIEKCTIGLQLVGERKQSSSLAGNANVVVAGENRPGFNVQLDLRKNRRSENEKNEKRNEAFGFAHFAVLELVCNYSGLFRRQKHLRQNY
jgi:hypothetical protein